MTNGETARPAHSIVTDPSLLWALGVRDGQEAPPIRVKLVPAEEKGDTSVNKWLGAGFRRAGQVNGGGIQALWCEASFRRSITEDQMKGYSEPGT